MTPDGIATAATDARVKWNVVAVVPLTRTVEEA